MNAASESGSKTFRRNGEIAKRAAATRFTWIPGVIPVMMPMHRPSMRDNRISVKSMMNRN